MTLLAIFDCTIIALNFVSTFINYLKMRKLLVFILMISSFISFSQTERLYYFVEKDSLLGVKNQNGKIIIPLQPSMNTDA